MLKAIIEQTAAIDRQPAQLKSMPGIASGFSEPALEPDFDVANIVLL